MPKLKKKSAEIRLFFFYLEKGKYVNLKKALRGITFPISISLGSSLYLLMIPWSFLQQLNSKLKERQKNTMP